jgi:hypothetical protein
VRFFLYRPETLQCDDEALTRLDWQSDLYLSSLIKLSVRLLGGSTMPEVFSLPILEPGGGCTDCRRALVLRAGGPTAILSPVRLPAFRPFFAWSFELTPSAATPGLELVFPERVARQAREVAKELISASFAPIE